MTNQSDGQVAAPKGWAPGLTVFVMGSAALLSAWAGFQSAKWGSEETISRAEVAADLAIAETIVAAGESLSDIQGEHFLDWLDADSQSNAELAETIVDRMSPEFRTAFEEWLLLRENEPEQAPSTPFETESWYPDYMKDANEVFDQADDISTDAREQNQTSDNYVLMTVVFASVLFLAGISQNTGRQLARGLVASACVVSGAGFLALALMPVTL